MNFSLRVRWSVPLVLGALLALACSGPRDELLPGNRPTGAGGVDGQPGNGGGGVVNPPGGGGLPNLPGGGGQTVPGGGGSPSIDGPSGSGGGPSSCVPGQTRCADTTPVVEVCGIGNVWSMLRTCDGFCANGACAGTCMPSDKQCAEQTPQVCNVAGEWEPAPAGCVNQACTGKGECTGECKPGDKKCGDGPNTLVPYECSDQGRWVAGTTCTNICSGGSCSGSCMPGKAQCAGNTPETCTEMGTWTRGQPCTNQACVDGVCRGECEPNKVQCGGNNDVQRCDSRGTWGGGARCSGKTCIKGACTGDCGPESKRCSDNKLQGCGSNGKWRDDENCGNANRTCLDNDRCGGDCASGRQQCSAGARQTCTSRGTWMSAECPNVANATASCTGNGTGCSYQASSGYHLCGSADRPTAYRDDDKAHCGTSCRNCDSGKPSGAANMACEGGQCVIDTCVSGSTKVGSGTGARCGCNADSACAGDQYCNTSTNRCEDSIGTGGRCNQNISSSRQCDNDMDSCKAAADGPVVCCRTCIYGGVCTSKDGRCRRRPGEWCEPGSDDCASTCGSVASRCRQAGGGDPPTWLSCTGGTPDPGCSGGCMNVGYCTSF